MNRIFRTITAAFSAAALSLSLGACSLTETSIEELMQPPQLTDSRKQIQETLTRLVGTPYALTFPQSGADRSGITLTDLDGDGQNEAVCLYTAGTPALVHVIVLQSTENGWQMIGQYDSDATTVDKLEFADVDGDGRQELVIGWGYLTGSDRVLEILQTGATMQALHTQLYSQFVVVGDKTRHIVVISAAEASAVLLGYHEGKVSSFSSVPMDSRAQSIFALQVGKTAAGGDAIYVDTQLDNQMYATEVLVVNADHYLENKLFTGERVLSDRTSAIRCTDIDGDGVLEIPQTVAMNQRAGAYYTYWYAFDGSALSEPTITFTSASDQFYFEYPAAWQGRILAARDEQIERLYHFTYSHSGGVLYSLRVFTPSEYAALPDDQGWNPVIESTDKVLAWQAGEAQAGAFALSAEDWAAALHTY